MVRRGGRGVEVELLVVENESSKMQSSVWSDLVEFEPIEAAELTVVTGSKIGLELEGDLLWKRDDIELLFLIAVTVSDSEVTIEVVVVTKGAPNWIKLLLVEEFEDWNELVLLLLLLFPLLSSPDETLAGLFFGLGRWRLEAKEENENFDVMEFLLLELESDAELESSVGVIAFEAVGGWWEVGLARLWLYELEGLIFSTSSHKKSAERRNED